MLKYILEYTWARYESLTITINFQLHLFQKHSEGKTPQLMTTYPMRE